MSEVFEDYWVTKKGSTREETNQSRYSLKEPVETTCADSSACRTLVMRKCVVILDSISYETSVKGKTSGTLTETSNSNNTTALYLQPNSISRSEGRKNLESVNAFGSISGMNDHKRSHRKRNKISSVSKQKNSISRVNEVIQGDDHDGMVNSAKQTAKVRRTKAIQWAPRVSKIPRIISRYHAQKGACVEKSDNIETFEGNKIELSSSTCYKMQSTAGGNEISRVASHSTKETTSSPPNKTFHAEAVDNLQKKSRNSRKQTENSCESIKSVKAGEPSRKYRICQSVNPDGKASADENFTVDKSQVTLLKDFTKHRISGTSKIVYASQTVGSESSVSVPKSSEKTKGFVKEMIEPGEPQVREACEEDAFVLEKTESYSRRKKTTLNSSYTQRLPQRDVRVTSGASKQRARKSFQNYQISEISSTVEKTNTSVINPEVFRSLEVQPSCLQTVKKSKNTSLERVVEISPVENSTDTPGAGQSAKKGSVSHEVQIGENHVKSKRVKEITSEPENQISYEECEEEQHAGSTSVTATTSSLKYSMAHKATRSRKRNGPRLQESDLEKAVTPSMYGDVVSEQGSALRRSTRQCFRPFESWRNERALFRFVDGTYEFVGIDEGGRDDSEWKHAAEKKRIKLTPSTKKPAKRQSKVSVNDNTLTKPRTEVPELMTLYETLSLECPESSPLNDDTFTKPRAEVPELMTPYEALSSECSESSSLHDDTFTKPRTEVPEVMTPYKTLSWERPASSSMNDETFSKPRTEVPELKIPYETLFWKHPENASYHYAKTVQFNDLSCGLIHIKPFGEKPLQQLPDHDIMFFVINSDVKIHTDTCDAILHGNDSFTVPQGLPYSLTNLSNKMAILYFSMMNKSGVTS